MFTISRAASHSLAIDSQTIILKYSDANQLYFHLAVMEDLRNLSQMHSLQIHEILPPMGDLM
jgi:hypothetical protein